MEIRGVGVDSGRGRTAGNGQGLAQAVVGAATGPYKGPIPTLLLCIVPTSFNAACCSVYLTSHSSQHALSDLR